MVLNVLNKTTRNPRSMADNRVTRCYRWKWEFRFGSWAKYISGFTPQPEKWCSKSSTETIWHQCKSTTQMLRLTGTKTSSNLNRLANCLLLQQLFHPHLGRCILSFCGILLHEILQRHPSLDPKVVDASAHLVSPEYIPLGKTKKKHILRYPAKHASSAKKHSSTAPKRMKINCNPQDPVRLREL